MISSVSANITRMRLSDPDRNGEAVHAHSQHDRADQQSRLRQMLSSRMLTRGRPSRSLTRT